MNKTKIDVTKIDIDNILAQADNINTNYKLDSKQSGFNDILYGKVLSVLYPDLFSKYESIVKIAASHSYDHNRLKFMLQKADDVANNKISEQDASVQVGTELVEKIVKPQMKQKL